MATIGRIRKHSTLLLIIVGGAIAMFVLQDLFDPGARGGCRRQQDNIAEVYGTKISAMDFYNRLDQQTEMYKMQYGENISGALAFQIREEVFNEMVKQTILQMQYDKTGIMVSAAEMADMMIGVNIHPIIQQNFTDPQTGVFNPAYVQNYLDNLESLEPAQQEQWYNLERIMKEERYFEKYQTMVQKAYFIPKAMAASMYSKNGKTADAKIISLKYSSIPDEDITLTDKDFEDFYAKHKHEYEQEESRWLEYVVFDILPDENDVKEGEVQIMNMYNEFSEIPSEQVRENYNFCHLYSDLDFDPDTMFMKRVMLPAQADTLFDMEPGDMIGPFAEENSYFMAKLLAREERADTMRASHILIPYRGAHGVDPSITTTKDEAQLKADSLLPLVEGVDNQIFAEFALEFSSCPSAQNSGGDLDWFADGQMVPEFNEACQNAKIGDYFIAESPFGFHIIHLTGKKAFIPKVKIAMLKFTIEASPETEQEIYTEASRFAGQGKSIESFNKVAEDNGYIVRVSEYTRNSDFSIPGIEEGREIVRWSFGEETETGNVELFEMIGENKNVVVIVKQVRNKGIAPLEQIKDLIEPLVRKEKKADMLYDKMNQAKSGATSLEDIAGKLNIDVLEIEYITFSSPNVPQIGPEPKVVGTVFGTEQGKISRTIRGEAGIFVVQPTVINEPPATDDYSMILFQQIGFFQNRVTFDVYNALLKKADMKDYRILFY